MIRGCWVVLLRASWFNSTKGVAYGHLEEWSCPGFVDRFVKSEKRHEAPLESVPGRSLYRILVDRSILSDNPDGFTTVWSSRGEPVFHGFCLERNFATCKRLVVFVDDKKLFKNGCLCNCLMDELGRQKTDELPDSELVGF